ncbi:MAG: tryptophan 7-halogenase [Nannocystaceae bacterium]
MELDVAIVGGGLAGAALARQLRRELPQLSIGLFERDGDGGWKVGESTVEIATSYFTRRLGLANYLYQEHLPQERAALSSTHPRATRRSSAWARSAPTGYRCTRRSRSIDNASMPTCGA